MLYRVVKRRVRARLEVSGSNSDLHKYAYFVKKMYLDSRGACGGGRLAGICLSFYFAVFKFLLFFHFLKNTL